ncbi:SEFIR domain-containing protein [Accumulibacter sp.]|uniref:SEFIR domain-containing protein n=1 Tax=Accumulibacter sp. TaxID=2053492 RepID=UPI0026229ABC|nr:SEFIR domain-containing protein [Accumulibacter sp.]
MPPIIHCERPAGHPHPQAMIDRPPRVFISYAQETEDHSAWVLALANRLRAEGVEAVIDHYVTWLEQGWRPWMSEQIKQADWVLVVCTEDYRKRFDGNAAEESGRGVRWESQYITQALYDDKFSNKRFVPVLPPAGDERFIPLPLKDYCSFSAYSTQSGHRFHGKLDTHST